VPPAQTSTDAASACHELEAAIWAAACREDWLSADHATFDLIQGGIVGWVKDAASGMERLAESLQVASAVSEKDEGPSAEALDALEDALVRAASVRDKLRAVAALVLGVPSLETYKRGVRFKPREKAIRTALSEAGASGSLQPGRVKALFEQVADHPAIVLRNDIIHAFAPFPQLSELCWIKTAHLDERGGIVGWDGGPLYPEGTLDLPDLLPWTLFNWALTAAKDVLGTLTELTEALAAMVMELGVITPPQSVYRWPDGRIQFEQP
jgi:hypothetical protein